MSEPPNRPENDWPKTWVPPGHYYSPLVDPQNRHVRYIVDGYEQSELLASEALLIDDGAMCKLFERLVAFYPELPFCAEKDPAFRYYLNNPAYSYGDAAAYFGIIRDRWPARIIEVGSGYSSCLVMDINDRFFGGSIDFQMIEPYPTVLRELLPESDPYWAKLHIRELQDMPTEFFLRLKANDILFIDSSHVCKTGSDVCDYLFRILPALNPGVLVHIHDILFPFEYVGEWIDGENRSWNEAYVLHAFLQYNNTFKIIYFCHYMYRRHRELLSAKMPVALKNSGGGIWLEKAAL